MRLAPATLVARVAWMNALTVAIAGALVALGAGLIAARLAHQREDRTLGDAAETLALELRGPGIDPVWIAADETRELEHAGVQVAVFEGGRFIGGDAQLVPLRPGTCADVGTRRACARLGARWIAVAAREPVALHDQQSAMITSGLVAVLVTSVLGALLALTVARRVLRPLWRLHASIQQLPDDPLQVDLGGPDRVAEVDALRAELTSAFARLGASLAQSRRFASDAAHELRTPLTKILGELDLAAERASGEDRVMLQRARRVADRLAGLVERLLILARLETPHALEALALRDLLDEAVDALPTEAHPRVHVACDEPGPWLRGDRPLLVTLLGNALENALKFSSGPVTVTLAGEGGEVLVAVSDEGAGVPESERARVFSPFYRTRASRAGGVPGHGIGLALIAHVVALHGGTVRFAAPERGARLEVRLPRIDPPTSGTA
ncbi:MAG: HAMP domain-containing sensor histidine kinase [Polyangiales bacterium]